MAAGGMYDQVGGGFHRYSVDAYWLVPHFEKMLYDQALLARAYLHGWLVTGEAALPPHRRGDDRLRAARPAPPRRRLLLRRGRRLRRRRGQVLPVVARRARGVSRRRRRPRSIRYFGVTARRQLRRPAHRVPRQHPARRRPRPRTGPTSVARRSPALFARARRRGSAPGSTTRCCSAGTRCSCARSPRPPPRSSAPTGWTRRARTPASCSRELRATTAACSGRGRTVAARPPRVRRGLRRAARGAAHPGRGRRRRVARRRARPSPTMLVRLFADDERGGVLHHRARRRGADRAPQGLPGQRDAVGELARRRRAAAARRAHRRRALRGRVPRGGSARWHRCSASTRRRSPTCSGRSTGGSPRRSRSRSSASPTTRPTRRRCVGELLPASVVIACRPARRRLTPLLADRGSSTAPTALRLRALRLPAAATGPARTRRLDVRAASRYVVSPAGHQRRGAARQLRGVARPSASCSAIAQPYAMTASPLAGSTSPTSSAAALPPGLDRAGVEHGLGRPVPVLSRNAAVVVAGVAAEAPGEPPAPGPLLAVRRVLRARARRRRATPSSEYAAGCATRPATSTSSSGNEIAARR